jgi:hypothetical protein
MVSLSETFHGDKITQQWHAEYYEYWTAHVEAILGDHDEVALANRREFAELWCRSCSGRQ